MLVTHIERLIQGRMGYFVKWKGYGKEENSWVDEKDAG
jgi:Chromo (CHRromatin Organisation MOdifier) domain